MQADSVKVTKKRQIPAAGQGKAGDRKRRPNPAREREKKREEAKKRRERIRRDPHAAMEVKNLSFAYGRNRVLQDVSLKIQTGKITTILGANGCGKSTLFSLMTRDLTPRRGRILLEGKSARNMSLKEFACRVAIVQQYNTAGDDVTVEQLVSFGRTPHRRMLQGNSDEDQRLINWAMEVTGLTRYRDREVSRLSGGQRQRVWIAMALAQNTRILFLDEPTTYLDIRYQLEILKLVQKLNREYGITIVMVLHDINQAIAFSDYLIGLKGGVVAMEGVPGEVITRENIKTLYGVELTVTTVENQLVVLTSDGIIPGREKEELPDLEEILSADLVATGVFPGEDEADLREGGEEQP